MFYITFRGNIFFTQMLHSNVHLLIAISFQSEVHSGCVRAFSVKQLPASDVKLMRAVRLNLTEPESHDNYMGSLLSEPSHITYSHLVLILNIICAVLNFSKWIKEVLRLYSVESTAPALITTSLEIIQGDHTVPKSLLMIKYFLHTYIQKDRIMAVEVNKHEEQLDTVAAWPLSTTS